MSSAIQTNDASLPFNSNCYHRIEAVVDTLPFDSHATCGEENASSEQEAQRRKTRQKQIDQNRSIRKCRQQEYMVSLRQRKEMTISTTAAAGVTAVVEKRNSAVAP